MTEYAKVLLFALLTVTFITTAYAGADGNRVSFNSADNMLLVPLAKVNDRYVANARLKLETNGQFVVESFIELSDSEQAIVEKIESLPCGSANILGKLAAQNAFVRGDESYCLVRKSFTTVEGHDTFVYLLIENGTAQFVDDNRLDGFGQCCFHDIFPDGIAQIRFGFVQDGAFIEQTATDQIDFEREYILQLTGEGDEIVEF